MKRTFFIANIITFAAFFLIVLGMRNPSLEHNRGPKQRPRAVIENVEKAPVVSCAQLDLEAQAVPTFTVAACFESYSHPELILSFSSVSATLSLPSRASPGHPSPSA